MAATFLTDEQTLQDIQIRDSRNRSIFDFFDQAVTEGGQHFLHQLFYSPQLDVQVIIERQEKIRRLTCVTEVPFPFYRVILKDLEKFVKRAHSGLRSSVGLMDIFGVRTPIYYYKKRSIIEACDFLVKLHAFYIQIDHPEKYPDIQESISTLRSCLSKLFKDKEWDADKLKVNIFTIDQFDRLVRYELAAQIKQIINDFYELDAYLAVAKVATAHSFCYPEVYPKNHTGKIILNGVRHIFHATPVTNNVEISKDKKLWFLTGANMAGKSSMIKSISVILYLMQIGFPVPAESVQSDLIDGLFTSINLQDNLELGYSHFYVEAMRLKTIMDQIEPQSNALVILDELFKGTNLKDASNAILQVMSSLAEIDGPYVIVSSHITELSVPLKNIPSIQFYKMNIESDDKGHPIFTYKLCPGVAEEKIGMWLLEESGAFAAINRLLPHRNDS